MAVAAVDWSSTAMEDCRKGSSMKSRFLCILAATVFALLAGAAAYAQSGAVTANVPFDFIVGKQVMPAGEYRITAPEPFLLAIQNKDGSEFLYAHSIPVQSALAVTPRLVFRNWGTGYYLVSVWDGNRVGNELLVRRAEMLLAKKGAPTEVAVPAQVH
jgi:hypothetical protein